MEFVRWCKIEIFVILGISKQGVSVQHVRLALIRRKLGKSSLAGSNWLPCDAQGKVGEDAGQAKEKYLFWGPVCRAAAINEGDHKHGSVNGSDSNRQGDQKARESPGPLKTSYLNPTLDKFSCDGETQRNDQARLGREHKEPEKAEGSLGI